MFRNNFFSELKEKLQRSLQKSPSLAKKNQHFAFSSRVIQNFGFLTSDYGFTVRQKRRNDPLAYLDDAEVIYENGFVRLEFALQMDDLRVVITPAGEPDVALMPLRTVLEYLTGQKQPHVSASHENTHQFEAWIDERLGWYQEILLQHCVPLITGEFTDWLPIYHIQLKKQEKRYLVLHSRPLTASALGSFIASKEKLQHPSGQPSQEPNQPNPAD